MSKHLKHAIILLVLTAAAFWSFCGIFVIAPIGILPEGKTIVFYRLGSGLPFLLSVESLQRKSGTSQSLFAKAMIFAELSEPIMKREIVSIGYSEWLYNLTINRENNISNDNFQMNYEDEAESAIRYIKVSELITTKATSTRVKVIGKIENTSTRNINMISYDLILMKNGKVVDVHTGFYPCNLNGNYGLHGLESCYFESRNFEQNTFDSFRIEIASAEF